VIDEVTAGGQEIHLKAYFVEGDFIFRFNRPVNGPATNPFIFNVVLGVSF
jgi:hypothetical protein